jgi:hypothetical protein
LLSRFALNKISLMTGQLLWFLIAFTLHILFYHIRCKIYCALHFGNENNL